MHPWAKAQAAKLRRARLDPPSAQSFKPVVDKIVRDASTTVAMRGGTSRVRVDASRTAVVVKATGPDAGAIMDAVRRGARSKRGEMREALRAEAQAKLRSHA